MRCWFCATDFFLVSMKHGDFPLILLLNYVALLLLMRNVPSVFAEVREFSIFFAFFSPIFCSMTFAFSFAFAFFVVILIVDGIFVFFSDE